MIRRWLVVTAVLLAGCAPAGALGSGDPSGGLQDLVDDWRHRTPVPGVVAGLAVPGAPDRILTSGSSVRGGPPLAPDAPFRVGSVTKALVATVILQLADEGRLDLDADVAPMVDDQVTEMLTGVTVRQLLSHTSGIPDVARSRQLFEEVTSEPRGVWTENQLLALAAGADREFGAGTAFGYSNTNYLVLGEVIEDVTGADWATEVQGRILDELDMDHSWIAGSGDGGAPVPGYFDLDGDGFTEPVPNPWPALDTSEGAAGALVSTAGDLMRFADGLFGGELLSDSALAEMTDPGTYGLRYSGYGLGLEILRPDLETTVWGHGGFVPGYRAVLWHQPGTGATVVVLTNESRSRPDGLAELLLGRLSG